MRDLMRRAVVVTGAVVALLSSAVGAASAAGTPTAPARQAGSGGGWGTAQEAPTAALGPDYGFSDAISCAGPAFCSAGGGYLDSFGGLQAFITDSRHGVWDPAQEVPGTAALNQGTAYVSSVSCARAGACSTIGSYVAASGLPQQFVASEVDGSWGPAEPIPGYAALADYPGPQGEPLGSSVSCARAGDCSAGGEYTDSNGHQQVFVVNEVDGSWGLAEQVPGTDLGVAAILSSVSCARPGACAAGGQYTDSAGHLHAFVVDEVNGSWSTAQAVPGISQAAGAVISSVSCAGAGACTTGGTDGQAFVADQRHGTWGAAAEVPGITVLDQGAYSYVTSVSCSRAGTCSAGGQYIDSAGHQQAFVADEVDGRWGLAQEVPGIATLNQGGNAYVTSVSCSRAGTCSAGGQYTDSAGHHQAFVVGEVDGRWRTAQEVPGTAALNQGGMATVSVVSCSPSGTCAVSGTYHDSHGSWKVFLDTKLT